MINVYESIQLAIGIFSLIICVGVGVMLVVLILQSAYRFFFGDWSL